MRKPPQITAQHIADGVSTIGPAVVGLLPGLVETVRSMARKNRSRSGGDGTSKRADPLDQSLGLLEQAHLTVVEELARAYGEVDYLRARLTASEEAQKELRAVLLLLTQRGNSGRAADPTTAD
jgi:hypothetical protein